MKESKAYQYYLDHREDPALYQREVSPHLTASALVFCPEKEALLMVNHLIFQSWSWPGGHADGDRDPEACARREVLEETGLELYEPGLLLDVRLLPVKDHYRKGALVQAHDHLNFTYGYKIKNPPSLHPKLDENKGVAWIPLDKLDQEVRESHMVKLYHELLNDWLSLPKRP